MGRVFKALLQQQSSIGIRMLDVKSSIQTGPLAEHDLQRSASAAITAALTAQGWFLLDTCGCLQLLRTNPFSLSPGQPCTSHAIKLSVSLRLPHTIVVHAESGMEQRCELVKSIAADQNTLEWMMNLIKYFIASASRLSSWHPRQSAIW